MAGNIRLNDNKGLSRMNSCLGAGRLCYLPSFVTIISVSAAKNFLQIDSFSGVIGSRRCHHRGCWELAAEATDTLLEEKLAVPDEWEE